MFYLAIQSDKLFAQCYTNRSQITGSLSEEAIVTHLGTWLTLRERLRVIWYKSANEQDNAHGAVKFS